MKIIKWTLKNFAYIIKNYGFIMWFNNYITDKKTETDAHKWNTKVEIIVRKVKK